MDQIASINMRQAKIKPHGERTHSAIDMASIQKWTQERSAIIVHRDIEDILRAVDLLNITTHWVQSKASYDQLDAVTDNLLLAMHDLRSSLVRRKADRFVKC